MEKATVKPKATEVPTIGDLSYALFEVQGSHKNKGAGADSFLFRAGGVGLGGGGEGSNAMNGSKYTIKNGGNSGESLSSMGPGGTTRLLNSTVQNKFGASHNDIWLQGGDSQFIHIIVGDVMGVALLSVI